MEKWYCESIDDIEIKLNTSVSVGLSRKEAENRREEKRKEGRKNLSPLYISNKKSLLWGILSPLSNLLLLLFLIVAVFTYISGEKQFGALAILLVLCFTVILGVMTLSAIRAKERSSLYFIPMVRVLRSGRVKYTSSENCVEGDVILLSKGDRKSVV